MSNNEKKMERIIALLEERGLVYKLSHHSALCDADIDIYVPKFRIAVFDGHSQEKYDKVKRKYAPLFVREEETEEFTVEKMNNLLADREKKLQWLQGTKEKREGNRRYAEECERRHQEKVAKREAEQAERERIRAEKAAAKAKAARPKRKRIVRYEKVI